LKSDHGWLEAKSTAGVDPTHSFYSRIGKIETQFYRIEERERLSERRPILQRGREERREEFFAFDF
jgi:hypothetical protein